MMIVKYDETTHVKKTKPQRKNRTTEQIFLFCKTTDKLVALQCNVCGEIKSLDEFADGSNTSHRLRYRCRKCENQRKKESKGYNANNVYIYLLTFSSDCIYIGRTKGLKGRMSVHISDLKRGNHCDKIISLYHQQPEHIIECIKNYKVLKVFDINTPKSVVDEYEYELQIDFHKKGFEVLGRQSVDANFLQYLLKTNRISNIFDCIDLQKQN